MARRTRRQVLRASMAGGLGAVAGCSSPSRSGRSTDATDGEGPPVDVRGAIYLPARAYNIYQMWHFYEPAVTERDLGYAARLNLNAVRTWLSYVQWATEPAELERSIEHFLTVADDNGLQVLLGLFDSVGVTVSQETLYDTDVTTAAPVVVPPISLMRDRSQWYRTRNYVNWFMDRYRNDDRLLAISVMNEPGWESYMRRFAREMFRVAERRRGTVPLTISSTSLANCARYYDWGSDVLQFHYNFPRDRQLVRDLLGEATDLEGWLDTPTWLTEWQRVRRSGGGFGGDISGREWAPNYASLAPVIREAGIGNFFWSLMLKPAWSPAQRTEGTINGVFHEDGAVWSLEDARAITSMSGDPSFDGTERRRKPDWMRIESDGESSERRAPALASR